MSDWGEFLESSVRRSARQAGFLAEALNDPGSSVWRFRIHERASAAEVSEGRSKYVVIEVDELELYSLVLEGEFRLTDSISGDSLDDHREELEELVGIAIAYLSGLGKVKIRRNVGLFARRSQLEYMWGSQRRVFVGPSDPPRLFRSGKQRG